MPGVFIHNGRIVDNGIPVITADNFGFRYGDGLFETMFVRNKKIRLRDLHFQRLFEGLRLLGFSHSQEFGPDFLEAEIMRLLDHTPLKEPFRVRLTVYRKGAEVEESLNPDYIIQCFEIGEDYMHFNKKGLTLGICSPEFRKNNDSIANLKSNNFLPYILASQYAKSRGWDDCLLLNPQDRIADATIANIFLIKNNIIFTPSLEEGPVKGTMRRYLIEQLPALGFDIVEKGITRNDLVDADELFLTNALFGIRWIGSFEEKIYKKEQVSFIYSKIYPFHE